MFRLWLVGALGLIKKRTWKKNKTNKILGVSSIQKIKKKVPFKNKSIIN